MGNKINPSCLKPQIDDTNFDNNSEYKIMNNTERKYRNHFKNEELDTNSNKSFSLKYQKKFYKSKKQNISGKSENSPKICKILLINKKI